MTEPNRVICTIELPSGAIFDVWSRFVRVVKSGEQLRGVCPVSVDTVCVRAMPQLPREYLAELRSVLEKAGIVTADQPIHWVGDQNTIESVCTCFGLPEGFQIRVR